MAGTVGKASFVAWTLKSQFRAEFDRQWSLGVIAEFLEPGGKSSCDSGELRREGELVLEGTRGHRKVEAGR